MDPWYSGSGLKCNMEPDKNVVVNKIIQWTKLQCNLAVSSLAIGWFTTFLCLITLFLAWKLIKSRISKIPSPDPPTPPIYDEIKHTFRKSRQAQPVHF